MVNVKRLDWQNEFDSSGTLGIPNQTKHYNMIKSVVKFTVLGLLAITVAGMPVVLHAQDTNATNAAATNKVSTNPSLRPLPLARSKVKAIDNGAMTITVANRTFQITSQTKLMKDGKPAVVADIIVGDEVTGLVKREADGKWTALKLNFGVAVPKKPASSNTKTNMP